MIYDFEDSEIEKENTPYWYVYENISENEKILDVGCASGYLGSLLNKKFENINLIGIDYLESHLKKAEEKKIYSNLIKIDLNSFKDELKEYTEYFDKIIVTDVLEHLNDPLNVLNKLSKYLKRGGKFLIDVPNISNGSIKYNILVNNFTYTDYGLLDKTHIKFFTPFTLIKELSNNNFLIDKLEYIFKDPTDDFFQPVKLSKYPLDVIEFIEQDPISYVYQIFMIIGKSNQSKKEILKNNNKFKSFSNKSFEKLEKYTIYPPNKEIRAVDSIIMNKNQEIEKLKKQLKENNNSVSSQIGKLMIKASHLSKTTFTWPYHLIRLFLRNKNKKINKSKKSSSKIELEEIQTFNSNQIDKILESNSSNKLIIKDYKDHGLESSKKRILYVLHGFGGGTEFAAKDLIKKINNDFDSYLLVPKDNKMELFYFNKNKFKLIHTWHLISNWSAKNFNLKEYRNIYFNIFYNLNIDLVHIHHFITQTFDLPIIAKFFNIPVVLSLHDYYLICPSINLIDDDSKYCEGKCEKSNVTCKDRSNFVFRDDSDAKLFVDKWRENVSKMFQNIDEIISTSKNVEKIFLSTYADALKNKKFHMIEHGRDFSKINEKLYEKPSSKRPIKILFSNVRDDTKGKKLIKNIKKQDLNSKLEFHFVGTTHPSLLKYGKFHGKFKRDDFYKKVGEIKPSFMGILSPWPETYCYVLSEAWSCEIPVLATKLGALDERITKHPGGWFINHENPQKAYEDILKIANNQEEYEAIQENIKNINFKTTKEMSDDYFEIYKNLLQKKDVNNEIK